MPKLMYELKEFDPNPNPDSVVLSPNGGFKFTILTSRLFRVERGGPTWDDRPTLAVINRNLPKVFFSTVRNGEKLVIETSDIQIHLDEGTNSLLAINRGSLQKWTLGDTPSKPLWGTIRTLDWLGAVDLDCATMSYEKSLCQPGLINRDGWGLLDDTDSPRLNGGDGDWWDAAQSEGVQLKNQDMYVFLHGLDFKGAIADYSKIGGSVPLPPRNTLGLQWTRWYNMDTGDLKDLVSSFPVRGIPLDTLILDMNWHKKPMWASYMFDTRIIPDPVAFSNWVKERGVSIALNIHDCLFITDNCPVGTLSIDDADLFEKYIASTQIVLEDNQTVIPLDLLNKTMALTKEDVALKPHADDLDIDMWWNDWQQGDGPGVGRLLGGKMNPTIWLNKLRYTNHKRWGMNKRGSVMGRFGGLGAHRYGHGFSGDVKGLTWENLAFQPYFTATAANVLFPLWTFDLTGPVTDPEMFVRWTQWSSFSPMLRFHDRGMSSSWCYYDSFPNAGSTCSTVDPWAGMPRRLAEAMRQSILLRARLLPYLYTEIWKTYDSGIPWFRPMYYDFPMEDLAFDLPGQFMFGDSITAAPVVTPSSVSVPSATLSSIWVPPGQWYSYQDGSVHEGPFMLARYWDIGEIPYLVKAGTMLAQRFVDSRAIPTANYLGMAMSNYTDIMFEIIPGSDSGEVQVYEDDGKSEDYVRNLNTGFLVATYQRNVEFGSIQFTVHVRGDFSEAISNRRVRFRVSNSAPFESAAASTAIPPVVGYDGESVSAEVYVDWDLTVDGSTISITASHGTLTTNNLSGLKGAMAHARLSKAALDEAILAPGSQPCWRGVPCGFQESDGSLIQAAVTAEILSGAKSVVDFERAVATFWIQFNDCIDREVTVENILRYGTQWSPSEWSDSARARVNYAIQILHTSLVPTTTSSTPPTDKSSSELAGSVYGASSIMLLPIILMN